MEWKKQLESLRAGLPKREEFKDEDKPEAKEADVSEDEKERRRFKEKREAEMHEKEADDTNPDFLALVRLLDLKKSQGEYFRVRDLFYKARRYDVEFDVNRWLGSRTLGLGSELEAIKDKLKKQGYCSEAYRCWLAAQPKGMRYGKGTKEERLKEAEKYAQKAGLALEEIIRNKSGN